MASQNDMPFEEFQEDILRQIEDRFDTRLKKEVQQFSPSGQPLPVSVTADVTTKFQQTFSNYLATAFDIVFSKEITAVDSANKQEKNTEKAVESDQHNLSVTNEQLQEMDNSVTKIARRRKMYPKKCSQFLEKSLELQAKAAEKIRVNVNNVEPLEQEDECAKTEESNIIDIQEKQEELQSFVRKQIQKSVRIEGSLRMLGETAPSE